MDGKESHALCNGGSHNMGCREASEADESDFQAAKGQPLPLPRAAVV